MKTKAIFFDKDGTLLDFDALWVPVTKEVLRGVARATNACETGVDDAMTALGIINGKAMPTGPIFWATNKVLAETIWKALVPHGCTATKEQTTEAVYELFPKHTGLGEIKPICPTLREDLRALKDAGIKLVLVTADMLPSAQYCLEQLNIADLFDTLYTDDGNTPAKPDPYCILDYLAKTGFSKDEVVMVGDAITDMNFAANAGIRAIGIASEQNRDILLQYTDTVIPDISQLQQNLR